jgi:hypothetical protein
VILMRMEDQPPALRLSRLQSVWSAIETHLPGHFIVVTRTRLRVRPLSPP